MAMMDASSLPSRPTPLYDFKNGEIAFLLPRNQEAPESHRIPMGRDRRRGNAQYLEDSAFGHPIIILWICSGASSPSSTDLLLGVALTSFKKMQPEAWISRRDNHTLPLEHPGSPYPWPLVFGQELKVLKLSAGRPSLSDFSAGLPRQSYCKIDHLVRAPLLQFRKYHKDQPSWHSPRVDFETFEFLTAKMDIPKDAYELYHNRARPVPSSLDSTSGTALMIASPSAINSRNSQMHLRDSIGSLPPQSEEETLYISRNGRVPDQKSIGSFDSSTPPSNEYELNSGWRATQQTKQAAPFPALAGYVPITFFQSVTCSATDKTSERAGNDSITSKDTEVDVNINVVPKASPPVIKPKDAEPIPKVSQLAMKPNDEDFPPLGAVGPSFRGRDLKGNKNRKR